VISPEGDVVYSADQSGEVAVWSLPGAERVNQFTVPESLGEPSWLYLSPNGQFLAIAGRSTVFAIYSVPDGALQHTLEHEDAPWLLFEFSPDSQYLVSFNYDPFHDNVIVWTLVDGKQIIKERLTEDVRPIFSPESEYLYLSSSSYVEIISLPEGEFVDAVEAHKIPITAQVINKGSGELITGDSRGRIKIWSILDGIEKSSLDADVLNLSDLYLHEEGKLLVVVDFATYSDLNKIKLFSLLDGSLITWLEIEYPSVIAEFSPNGKNLGIIETSGDMVSKVRLFAIESEEILIDQTIQGNLRVAFSPDSRHLLIGDGLGKMNVYSLEDGKVVACMVDLAASGEDTEGREYSIEVEGEIVTYTLPCGSPLPTGAVCVCDCVSGSGCACVGHTACSCVGDVCSCVSHAGGSHYWYPN